MGNIETFDGQKVMHVRVGVIKSIEAKAIGESAHALSYEPGHFYFQTEDLVHEVMNPKAIKLLGKIRSGKLYEFGSHKSELDRLLKHGIIELRENGYYFDYDLIKFDYHVYI